MKRAMEPATREDFPNHEKSSGRKRKKPEPGSGFLRFLALLFSWLESFVGHAGSGLHVGKSCWTCRFWPPRWEVSLEFLGVLHPVQHQMNPGSVSMIPALARYWQAEAGVQFISESEIKNGHLLCASVLGSLLGRVLHPVQHQMSQFNTR